LGYEVNIDDTRDIIEALLNEPIDPKAAYFGTYDEAKTRISLEIEIPQVLKRGKKRMEIIKKRNWKRKMILL
jgi:regulator of RNase E activity RraB